MASPAEVIKDLLVTAGVGVFASTNPAQWGIYVSRQPTDIDRCIVIYDAGGLPPNPQFKLDYPSVQIRVRGAKQGYQAAYAKIQACQNALLGLPSQTIGSDRWVSVAMQGFIQPLGYDEHERPELTANFRLIIEPSASSYREAL